MSIPGGLTTKEADPFDISFIEVTFEICNGVVGSREFAPVTHVLRKNA